MVSNGVRVTKGGGGQERASFQTRKQGKGAVMIPSPRGATAIFALAGQDEPFCWEHPTEGWDKILLPHNYSVTLPQSYELLK